MRCPKLTIKKNSCTNKKTATITENWAKGPNRRFTERRSKEAATKYSDIEATSNHRNTNQSIVISPCAHSIGKGQTFGNARCRRARGRVAGWSSPGASPGTAQLGLHPPPHNLAVTQPSVPPGGPEAGPRLPFPVTELHLHSLLHVSLLRVPIPSVRGSSRGPASACGA